MEKIVSRSTLKILTMKIFDPSHSRYVPLRAELVLLRGGLPSEIALQGGRLDSKIVYRGVGADFEKPEIYFQFTMTG